MKQWLQIENAIDIQREHIKGLKINRMTKTKTYSIEQYTLWKLQEKRDDMLNKGE